MQTKPEAENRKVEIFTKIPLAISDRLHQMAQPLTVLCGLLDLSLIEGDCDCGHRRGVERMLTESRRAIRYLNEARELASLARPVNDVDSFSVTVLLVTLLEQTGRSVVIQRIGEGPAGSSYEDDLITISRGRFTRALDLIISSFIPSHSPVTLLVTRSGTSLTLGVQVNGGLPLTCIPDAENNLAIAEVILASIEAVATVDVSAGLISLRFDDLKSQSKKGGSAQC